MTVIAFIIGAVVFGAVAIGLGVTFFNTSVREEEHQKGWDSEE